MYWPWSILFSVGHPLRSFGHIWADYIHHHHNSCRRDHIEGACHKTDIFQGADGSWGSQFWNFTQMRNVVVGHWEADWGGWWTSTKARSWSDSHRIQKGQNAEIFREYMYINISHYINFNYLIFQIFLRANIFWPFAESLPKINFFVICGRD